MKIDIQNVEKRTGLLRRRLYGVKTTVVFTEEEAAIIKERNLFCSVVMEREWGADVDAKSKENRSFLSRLTTTIISGSHANTPDLCVDGLMRGPDTYYMYNTAEAKVYIAELREKLKDFKKAINLSAEAATNESFEL